MNREIEFRAWLKNEKKMYGVSEIHFSSEGIEYIVCCDLETYDRPYFYVDLKDIELIQYTGLKDTNGVKIFEGDIVEFSGDEIGVIKYTDGCFEIEADGFTETFYSNRYAYEVEVIGNIYENKELLNENFKFN